MKYSFILLLLFVGIHAFSQDVYVHGYYKKNGTYVKPHYRSHPDGNPYNNWSFPGNTNPYTGKTATGNSAMYLRNHNNAIHNSDLYPSAKNAFTSHQTMTDERTESTDGYHIRHSSNYYVTASSLNIRSGPSISYSKIGSLFFKEKVTVVKSFNNGWQKIAYHYYDISAYSRRFKVGYVYGEYLAGSETDQNDSYQNTPNVNNNYKTEAFSSAYGSHNGRITFWTDCGNEGEISLFVDGQYIGKLTAYFTEDHPECGSLGTLSIERAAGSYTIRAESNAQTWRGRVIVHEGRCTVEGIRK